MPLEPLWVRASRRNSGAAGQRENRRGRAGFRAAISEDVLPRIRAFAPDLLLLSAGFDGADGDDGNAQVVNRPSPDPDPHPHPDPDPRACRVRVRVALAMLLYSTL